MSFPKIFDIYSSMKRPYTVLLVMFALGSCAGQKDAIILRPDSARDQPDQAVPSESWRIVETQNGSPQAGIPAWVDCYVNGKTHDIESLNAYRSKYVFIGENRGDNFNALVQWADNFTITHDLPGLVARRTEQRLIDSAVLYPDDEYGEYFAAVIKKAADGEYPNAVREETFWIKKNMKIINNENIEDEDAVPADTEFERFEFLVLISINREALQKNIQEIMAGTKTTVPPTRNQSAAIKKVTETFFEGF